VERIGQGRVAGQGGIVTGWRVGTELTEWSEEAERAGVVLFGSGSNI
jgi:hypothetical protein